MKRQKHPLIAGTLILTATGVVTRFIGFFYKRNYCFCIVHTVCYPYFRSSGSNFYKSIFRIKPIHSFYSEIL